MSKSNSKPNDDLAPSPYAALARLAKSVKDEAGFPVNSANILLYVPDEVYAQLAAANPELVETRGNVRQALHVALGDNDLEIVTDIFSPPSSEEPGETGDEE